MTKYRRLFSYIEKPFLIYDFAPDPFRIFRMFEETFLFFFNSARLWMGVRVKRLLGLSSIRAKQQRLFCLQFLLMYTEKTMKTTLIAGLAQVGGKNERGEGRKNSQQLKVDL